MRVKKERDKGKKTDYGDYRLSWREWGFYTAESVGLCIVINYLFYKSLAAFLFMLPIPFWYIRKRKKQKIKERKKRLTNQFRTALGALQAGISAGYSLENAIKESKKDIERLHGKEAELAKEISFMEIQMARSVSLEELLYDLGMRSRIEDIKNFSEVLIYSKKAGGNMREILQKCILSMEEHMDIKREIDASLAARKMEQRIMSLIPLGIILYLQLSSPEFLSVLYGNPAGIGTMTICFVVYLVACQWGAKMVEIEV